MNTFRYKTTPRLRRMLLAVGAAVAALAGVAPAKATAVPQPVPLPHVPIPTSPSLPLPSLSVPGLHVPGAPGAKAPQTNARPINGGTGGGNCLANGGTGRPDAFVQDPATGGIQSQFDGWVQVAPSNVIIGGVYSKIDTYLNQQASGAVGPYTPADGDSNAWTGLGGAGHATLLYQIGYIKTGSQIANGTNYNLNVFWEVLDPASQFNNVRKLVAQLTSVNAAPHYYTTLYDPVWA